MPWQAPCLLKGSRPAKCALDCPRFLGFGGEANRVATDQEVRRKTVTGRQTRHNLRYLGGITDVFPPIRFQGLGNGPDGRFIVRKRFRHVLISAGAPIRPHATGLKGAHLHAERRQLLGKRFREASDSPFRCMVRRATKPSSRFVSRAVATSRSPDSSTASAMFRPKPLALPVTNQTLFINSCLSSSHLLPGFRSPERGPQPGGCRPLPRSESSIE